MYLNTKQLINITTGKNKSFLTRVSKQQEEKYGNVDIFDAHIDPYFYNERVRIIIGFGDYTITFFFDDSNHCFDKTGNGQGHRYANSLEAIATELAQKFKRGEC